jgi:hypothetical protein
MVLAPCHRGIDLGALDFERVAVPSLSSRGTPYVRWVPIGMPKIPERVLDSTFYLFRTKAEAEAGHDIGGTGFFVGLPSVVRPGLLHIVAVTNYHVAISGAASVVRLNRIDGGVDAFETEPTEWIYDPSGYDAAILPWPASVDQHRVTCITQTIFAHKGRIHGHDIGPGDDVFMVGRFVDHDGGATNIPAVRFGHISIMPQPILQRNGASPPSYVIDMHSRSGFSGSPVLVYRTIGQDLTVPGLVSQKNTFLMLLGIHWGQFPESWKIKKTENVDATSGEINLNADAHYIEGLSGMTCVAPVEAISALLEHERIKLWYDQEERILSPDGRVYPLEESA